MKLSSQDIRKFRKQIWDFYRNHKREMPWRGEKSAYRVLVSEIMLQQTQVSRVMGKYGEFLKAFPTMKALADASLKEVLKSWQGLGYNRRARNLWLLAREVKEHHKGKLPKTQEELQELPGLGKATAGSVAAFAFRVPTVFIETNVRRVFLHSFFPKKKDVPDTELMPLIEATLERENPREWYYALMDYGVYLKNTVENPNRKSKHYKKQAKFVGSNREVRGAIVRALAREPLSKRRLEKEIGFEKERFANALQGLQQEGMVVRSGNMFSLPL